MSIPKTHWVTIVDQVSESPDSIQYREVEAPQISGPNDIIIKNKYAGVNFIETYFRKGQYDAQFPFIFGREALGVVAAVGANVKDFRVGDKVFYLSPRTQAQYTKIVYDGQYHAIHKLPEDATEDELKLYGAILVQGLTAITFAHEARKVEKGQFVVVWAAAGGTGQAFTQYVSSLGGRVIAIASSEEKLEIAKLLGAEFLINSLKDDVEKKVHTFTDGHGADAVFDGVGADAFDASLNSLARKGSLVSFGKSSGFLKPFSIRRLQPKNLKVLSPTLFGYIATKEEWDRYIKILLEQVKSNRLKFALHTYQLKDYPQAASDLENRKTTGKLVLEIPQ